MMSKWNPSTGSLWRHVGVVAAAVIVALAIWALARLLGVELTVGKGQHPSEVGVVDVVVAALLAGLAAWGTRALLARRGADGAWPIVGATALGISYIGPSYLADGLSALVLIAMHLAVGLVLIAGFSRFTPRPSDQRRHAWQ
ncbi:MAG TPA: DUF6069 family protein [Actinomycetota bacterium]|nr:DUF6069 family protein [Actinomycetota bacterium]